MNIDLSKLSLEEKIAYRNALDQQILDQMAAEMVQQQAEIAPLLIPEIAEEIDQQIEDDAIDPQDLLNAEGLIRARANDLGFKQNQDILAKAYWDDIKRKIKKEEDAYAELVSLGFAEPEVGETEYETMIFQKLRDNRSYNTKVGIIKQKSIAKQLVNGGDPYDDLYNDPDVMYVDDYFRVILKHSHDNIYKSGQIVNANINIFYAVIVDQIILNPRTNQLESSLFYSLKTTKISRFSKNINPLILDNEDPNYLDFKIELPDSGSRYVFLGYSVIYETKLFKALTKQTLYDLKAYQPSSNRKYHELTSGSTTNNKICVYETFLDVIGLRELKYKRDTKNNKKEIEYLLKSEGEEIEKCVRNGELVKSLELLTKKYNADTMIRFFKDSENPIIIEKGISRQLEDNIVPDKYKNKKHIFTEKNIHVAPSLKTDIYKKKEEKKVEFYQLRPKKIKKQVDLLKQLDNRKVKNILGYDTETYLNEELDCQIFAICFYGIINNKDISKAIYGPKEHCISEFKIFIESICIKKNNKKSRPNESIDDIFIYGWNNSNFDNLGVYSSLYEEDPATKILFTNNSIKHIKYNNIQFFDLNLYYPGSLNAAAKAFKLKDNKGVFPYTFPNKDNLNYVGDIPDKKYFNSDDDYDKCLEQLNGNKFDLEKITKEYCLLDAKLVFEMAKLHLEQSIQIINNEICDVQKCSTGAGIALKCFKQIFMEDTLNQSPNKIIENERASYKGGRTEVFKKFFRHYDIKNSEDEQIEKEDNRLFYYDINSSYPSSMLKTMPFEYIKTMIKEGILNYDEIVDYNNYYAKITYKGDNKNFIPNILIRSNGNIIASKNSDYAYHWGIELKEAINNNCEVEVKSVDIYTGKKIFNIFSEYFYNQRLLCKKSNIAKALFFKLLLNSLYGKFGQNPYTKKEMVKDANEMYKCLGKDRILIGFELLDNGNILFEYEDTDNDKQIGSLVRFASYITACSRSKLSDIMRDIGHEHIYYCDTDSIFTDKKPSNKYISNDKLGKWKLECEPIIHANFVAPKSYNYITEDEEEDSKFKGINAKNLSKSDYDKLVAGITKRIAINKKMFFRSFNNVKIDDRIRRVRTIYNKRIWKGNNSEPFNNIEEWKSNKSYQKNYESVLSELKKYSQDYNDSFDGYSRYDYLRYGLESNGIDWEKKFI